MNKKKKERKRKANGPLTFNEHMEKREKDMLKSWEKTSKKNKGKKPFSK